MLASDIDAVVIASPIGVHYEQAMKAIHAGKHLHLNKTMTTTVAEADEVISAAKEARVKVVASPGRAHRHFARRVKEIVTSGEIGRVYWAETGTAGGSHESGGSNLLSHKALSKNVVFYSLKALTLVNQGSLPPTLTRLF